MGAYKEELINISDVFPVEVFIQDNEQVSILVESHWHDCIEVLCMLGGSAKQQVNEKVFYTQAYDVLVIKQGDIHSTWCKEDERCKILVLKFLPEFVENTSSIYESKYINSFLQSANKQICYMKNLASQQSDLYALFMGILREFENKEIGYEISIKGYIYQIMAIFMRNGTLSFDNETMREKDFKMIMPLIKYIEKNYYENITLDKAANMVNMSYYHFSRYFKKVTGRNFTQYIDFVRISEADKLLILSDIPISQIAYEVGYNHLSSFNRVYKRIRGYTPSTIKRANSDKL